MQAIKKQNIIILFVSLLVSICINSYFYFSKKNLYDSLKEKGKISQVYTKYLGSEGTPWYYGKPAADYYFISTSGDTIRGREPSLTPDSFSTNNYIPNKLVLYKPDEPKKYMFLDDYNIYSDTYNMVMYFGVGIPFSTIILMFIYIFIKRIRDSGFGAIRHIKKI